MNENQNLLDEVKNKFKNNKIIVTIVIIFIILSSVFDLFGKFIKVVEYFKEVGPVSKDTIIKVETSTELPVNQFANDTITKVEISPKLPPNPPINDTIIKVIRFNGKPIKNAHFTISECDQCQSTISDYDGKVKIIVPTKITQSDIEYDFSVFKNSKPLYKRSMKFSNLNLDY